MECSLELSGYKGYEIEVPSLEWYQMSSDTRYHKNEDPSLDDSYNPRIVRIKR